MTNAAARETVSLTRQEPAAADVRLELDDRPPSAVWREVFAPDGLRIAAVDAARAFAAGRTVPELYDALDDLDVPAFLATLIRDLAAGTHAESGNTTPYDLGIAVGRLFDLTAGGISIEDALGVVRLFERVDDVSPSVAVRIDAAFFERRRDQRETICRLLDALAAGADVTIYGSPIELRRLATDHRADLAGVSESWDQPRDSTPVSAALERLGRDGRPVEFLRTIADEPGEATTTSALYASATVSRSRVRQVLGTLDDVGCIETYGSQQNRFVEVTSTGREFLAEIGRQSTLNSGVSDTVQSSQQFRVNPSEDGGGEEAGPYRTAYLNRPETAAAVGCGVDGQVTLVEDGAFSGATDRTRYVSYAEDDDEAGVAIRASTPLQYAVSLATALASPEFFDRVLPADRLDAIEEPAAILRGARCIGGVSKAAEDDPQELRDTLVEWGDDLADMTRDLNAEEYDDRERFRGDIMQSAHGLAGSIVHLLDAAGVGLTREIRVPERLSGEQLDAVTTSIAHSLAIQSRYESHAAYRQLYEDREEKRTSAFSVDVDAADPAGTLIGSVVVRSLAADRVGDALGDAVRHHLDPVEDAPEFAVSIPVRRAGRHAYRRVTERLTGRKRLETTDAAVRTLAALTTSPYAAAEALAELGAESFGREIEGRDLRFGLSRLPPSRLVDVPPTARKILSALLAAETPLSQTALAEAADVSTSSVRRHSDTLAALGVAERTEAGYRCSLGFDDERHADRDGIEALDARAALDAVLSTQLPPERYADPEDDLAAALFYPPDPWRVLDDPPPELAGWLAAARVLTEPSKSPKKPEPGGEGVAAIELGETTAQTPVTATDDTTPAPATD